GWSEWMMEIGSSGNWDIGTPNLTTETQRILDRVIARDREIGRLVDPEAIPSLSFAHFQGLIFNFGDFGNSGNSWRIGVSS
ncbi:MAG TPA: hypothetical protein VGJ51_17440, partial [Candidatus Angelobacter sp.]